MFSTAIDLARVQLASLTLLLGTLVLGLAAPALAQTEAVTPSSAPPQSRERIASDLYYSVVMDLPEAEIGDALFRVLQHERQACEWLSEYQIYRASRRAITFKTKCAGTPIYAITVTKDFDMQVIGGDGLIVPFAYEDGPIIGLSRPLQRQDGLTILRQAQSGVDTRPINNDLVRRTPQVMSQPRLSPWVVISVILNVLLVIGLITGFFLFANLRRHKSLSKVVKEGEVVTSESKDELISESTEIMPFVFSHPSGMVIVKGKRGKRRIFPAVPLALLYRKTGIKLLEIH